MRALTVRQPWATLLALGVKQFETRSRPTRIRGRIAIHAGKAMPTLSRHRCFVGPFEVMQDWNLELQLHNPTAVGGIGPWAPLPLGAVVATADLVDCVPTDDTRISQIEWQLGDWTPGRWAWRLDDVQPLAVPVPAKGRQGWWDWTPDEGGA